MTKLCIISQLYSKQLDKRAAFVKITEDALTLATVKDDMTETLGYAVELLSRWVIVRGPHKSTPKDQNHITVRGDLGGDHAITAHLYLDLNDQFERHEAFTDGKPVNAKVTCMRSNIY
ncbi:hypothetical protein EYR38_010009 [Pleurotus pulmonarius]|nr:hypothetical protein EYR38_010009 [Pleurotus pulmonarius]